MWFPNLFQIQMALFNNRIVGLVLRGMYFGKSSFGQGVKRKEMFLSYYYVLGKNPGVSERFALISFRTFHCWELKATSSGQAASSLYSSMIVWGSRVHTRSSCEDRECTPVHSTDLEMCWSSHRTKRRHKKLLITELNFACVIVPEVWKCKI